MYRIALLFVVIVGCWLTIRGVWKCFEAKTAEDLGNAIGFGIAGLAVLIVYAIFTLSDR